MNADKRRRARVQGGWSAASSTQGHGNRSKHSASSHFTQQGNTPQTKPDNQPAPKEPYSARSDKGKPPMPVGPIWLGKNIDQPSLQRKFVFEEPEEEIKMKPTDQVLTKPGVYDISTEPSGVSRLRYFPQFVQPSQCEAIFAELYSEIPWRQRHDVHNGVQAIQPRLTAWYSDLPYTYSGGTVEANTSEWPRALKQLREQLAEVTGVEFNSLAANLYRDGHDSIGWHSDDEAIFGPTPIIASLSFGDERLFELRKKPPPNESGERDYTYSQVIKVLLKNGALLIMEGYTQADWQHRVGKEYHDRDARINVTFRVVQPPPQRGVR